MPRYMLDTDISSYIMGRKNQAVMRRFENTPVAEMCISVVKRAELAFGMQIHPKKHQTSLALEDYLKYIEVLDLPSEAAIEYGEIRADLKARGVLIDANDLLIAAHARHLNLVLVTNNMREFKRVQGLKLENWTEP
jgi:tRNA(fMet)-specific endonuclease VapC